MQSHKDVDTSKSSIVTGEYKIVKIPEGIVNVNELKVIGDKTAKAGKSTINSNRAQAHIVKQLEKMIKKQAQKHLVKTAAIRDVQQALGKKYIIERDKNYKCRRWVVTKGNKEWYIRYNDPLCCAIIYIEEYGAAKFLKEYSMKSKYNE